MTPKEEKAVFRHPDCDISCQEMFDGVSGECRTGCAVLRKRIEEIRHQATVKKVDTVLVQEWEAIQLCDMALLDLSRPTPGWVESYDQGFLDGVRAYAWHKDGQQEVGTTGRTLKYALEHFRETWNYQPPAPGAEKAKP